MGDLQPKGDIRHDEALARKAADGCEASFKALFTRYYPEIRNFAFRRCHCMETANDISQTVFIRVARTVADFRHESSFRSWLYQIAINCLRDDVRKRGTYDRHVAEFGEASDGVASKNAPVPSALLQAIQLIESLPEALRDAVVLVSAQGLTHREAAEVLGCPEGTVAWKISEARRHLTDHKNAAQA
ncbi:RNA polymerase sigma factor [Luteolibacter soli]|uniref:RNA polymerase sigma factor n=1 Tax=Luteolibacter soli TaxID=3135280 RepID=A0ABU9B2I7_9BACT